ncbi:MAG: YeeE/YedE family protein [Rhodospirillales bacterium]|nr:YeeE/YedE family protein [Rhodospirillales bacterium]MBO6788676.1 YeeE/YedE family protein [Rhodospirillales bacterium]
MSDIEPRTALLIGALVVGVGFGVIARLSAFCFRSAVLELLARRVGFQVRAWAVAIATAVAATQAMSWFGIVDISESIYLSTSLMWLTLIVGGVLFGIGMILARGCGARHMVLLASGNLRSAVVLSVLGIVAYMTLRGILAIPRTTLEGIGTLDLEALGYASQSLGALSGGSEIVPLAFAAAFIAIAVAVALRGGLEKRVRPVLTGLGVGALIAAGWYVTGVLGFDEFEPVRTESLTFTAPVGNAIQYLMTYTGATADFGIVAVGGVIIGAFAIAVTRGEWVLQGFETPHQLLRYTLGGALMGFGGVMALGCTVGQGLSGLSTLSVGSILAVVSIGIGAVIGDVLVRREFAPRQAKVQPAE